MQAYRVPYKMVHMMLEVLQQMQYYLRTGFGQANVPFGSCPDDPCFGLGQGNGAAPPGFSAISTLMINSYKSCNHGMRVLTPYSLLSFVLAAILYVDDTDLLHWDHLFQLSDDQFRQKVQLAITAWGNIVQATGGHLKQKKCFWYMMSWKFPNGCPRLKKIHELPPTPLVIPQPGGTPVPIRLKEVSESTETLGAYSNPAGNYTAQLYEMVVKGNKWLDRLHSRYLKLRPGMFYANVSILAPPKKIDDAIHKIYFRAHHWVSTDIFKRSGVFFLTSFKGWLCHTRHWMFCIRKFVLSFAFGNRPQ